MFTIAIHQRSANQNVIEIPSPHRTERLSSGEERTNAARIWGRGVWDAFIHARGTGNYCDQYVTSNFSLKFLKELKLEVSEFSSTTPGCVPQGRI